MTDRNHDYAGGDRAFSMWLRSVDGLCERAIGLSIHDLRDHMWRDLYDDDISPMEAWEIAMEDGILEP